MDLNRSASESLNSVLSSTRRIRSVNHLFANIYIIEMTRSLIGLLQLGTPIEPYTENFKQVDRSEHLG